MSRRDWLHYVAVRGFVILILFASTSFAQEPRKPNAPADQQQSTTKREKPNKTRPTPSNQKTRSENEIARDAGLTENKKSKTKIYRSPCGDTEDHDKADLCEQQRMSAAAERAADYAYWQLWVGTIGLPLIVGSLLFAAIAAFAARDAAFAARDQAGLTEQTAEKQLRAYVNAEADGIHIWELGFIAHARVVARNVGQTPAYDVTVAANLQALREPPKKDITGDSKIVISGDMYIAPGQRQIIGFDAPISDIDIEHVTADNKWAVFAGYIKYRDVFGVERETRFCHLYKGKGRLSKEYVRYHHIGNSAT